jgi:protocatechuate 3,4-dioxygenase beta subunit
VTDLSRRDALTALGTVSLGALLAACSRDGSPATVTTAAGTTATVQPSTSGSSGDLFDGAATCTLTLEQTEGPFYFDVDSIRSDIREDREGTPLALALRAEDTEGCVPIPDAVVEIWHCDAAGAYSGFESGTMGAGRTDDETYLRGAQVTDAEGVVRFTSIYPGWYPGRTAHIHVKVHVTGASTLTSQLYFDDTVSDDVYAAAPYPSGRDTTNATDGIFDASTVLTLRTQDEGYLGVMTIGVAR